VTLFSSEIYFQSQIENHPLVSKLFIADESTISFSSGSWQLYMSMTTDILRERFRNDFYWFRFVT